MHEGILQLTTVCLYSFPKYCNFPRQQHPQFFFLTKDEHKLEHRTIFNPNIYMQSRKASESDALSLSCFGIWREPK